MFAQTNYPQQMGAGGTIAEHGGLLTAFSNLLEYYGEGVDPVTLNYYFEQHNVSGDLNWATIREYDGNITVAGQGVGTHPTVFPAIVRSAEDYYLVTDNDIVSSLSGETGAYYGVEEWVSYSKPEAAQPEPEPQRMVYVENEVDGILYKRLPTAPQRLYVINPKGTDKQDFGANIKTFRDFVGVPDTHKAYGAEVRVMGTAHYPIVPTGQDFYVDIDDWADFTGTGHVANMYGYPVGDLSDVKPATKPVVPVKESLPKPTGLVMTNNPLSDIRPQTIDTVRVTPTPFDMHFQYFNEDRSPVRFRVMRRCIVQDYGHEGKPQEILRGKTIKLLGTFYYRNRVFALPALDNPDIPRFKYWYGVPEVDGQGNRIIEELPDYSDVEQTVTEAKAELPMRKTTWAHYVTYYQEKVSHSIERRLLQLKQGNKR